MLNDRIVWSINTLTQKQSFFNPPGKRRHGGSLEALLNKVLPSMGRSDIPSHIISIIKHYGHGILELPGDQRWDWLRLHFRNDAVKLVIDYEAYKSDFVVTNVTNDKGITFDMVSELKVPNKWLGESEINSEAVSYAALGEMVETDETEQKFRQALHRARARTNTRISAVGAVVGSHDAVVKASNALKEFMADKEITPIVPDAERVGQLRTIDAADQFFDAGRLNNSAPRLTMIKHRAPSAEFDGDEIHANESTQLRHFQWRTRNPSIKAFLDEGRELYEDVDMSLSIIKTDYLDYQWFVKLVRRDIYRNAIFLSPALLVKTLHLYPGVVGADRKTALRAIKKTYKRCISKRLRGLYNRSVWELKNRAIRVTLLDWGKGDYARAVRGMQRRQLINDIRACPTPTHQCMTGEDKE